MKTPISILITTFNEENNLIDLLPSLVWADEILIVDSFSTDQTVIVAKQMACRVVQRVYQGPADQKNWAIPQLKHPWVLILDADERLSEELISEIKTLVLSPNTLYDGFWIHRQNYFMGKKIRYSGWQGDAVIRLIQRDNCRYNNKQVHEEIEQYEKKIGKLQASLDHYTYKDLQHFMAKMERYATWSAQDYLYKTPKVTLYHLGVKPFFRFINHFILKKGFLDGTVGFIISSIMAWGVFMRYAKIKEILNNKSIL